jgi:hypothetical protein
MNNFSRLEALDAENVPIIVENRLWGRHHFLFYIQLSLIFNAN